jgi:DNA helicase HerA-like ATPase
MASGMYEESRIGKIIGGSYSEGLAIKVEDDSVVESTRIGTILVSETAKRKYYCMLTDMVIEGMNKQALTELPRGTSNYLLNRITKGTSIYTVFKAQPVLSFDLEERKNQPIRNIPPHASSVRRATYNDISDVFGSFEKDPNRYFPVGNILDMDESSTVCIDMERFIERSSGIYGRTGTGKSFIARLLMAGIILCDKASLLIFDAHSDHGPDSVDEENRPVKGLKSLFGTKVQIMTIENTSSMAGVLPIEIDVRDVEIEDILSIAEELNLNETAQQVMIALKNKLDAEGKHWLEEILVNGEDLAERFKDSEAVVNRSSLLALIRKLSVLKELPYLRYDRRPGTNSIDIILNYLQKGISVDITFGKSDKLLNYLFVTNVLSRRIYQRYMEMYERYISNRQKYSPPRPLVIAIEEAHRFLSPDVAKQTIFGTIAREMRKAKVSLMCIDQRPSQIDSEIASQIGTRVILSLSDEADITSALAGMKNSKQLRAIIESLDSKQQALLIGHAVPMPVAIKTKGYDSSFYDFISIYLKKDEVDEKYEKTIEASKKWLDEMDY